MALLVCEDCTTVFASGLEACPHCQGVNFHEQGADMAKSTRAAGATNKHTDAPAEPEETPDAAPEMPAASAPKSEWLDWASDAGAPESVLEGTKGEIQEWAAGQ